MLAYYCPNCGASLNEQDGFTPDCDIYKCIKCSQILMSGDIAESDTFHNIAWFCDGCGALMNKQPLFSDSNSRWRCTVCGQFNDISESQIHEREPDDGPQKGVLSTEQIAYLLSKGLDLNYLALSDDEWVLIEDFAGSRLTEACLDEDYKPNEEGEMGLSILDNLP